MNGGGPALPVPSSTRSAISIQHRQKSGGMAQKSLKILGTKRRSFALFICEGGRKSHPPILSLTDISRLSVRNGCLLAGADNTSEMTMIALSEKNLVRPPRCQPWSFRSTGERVARLALRTFHSERNQCRQTTAMAASRIA